MTVFALARCGGLTLSSLRFGSVRRPEAGGQHSLINTTDDEILAEAQRGGWTLVTFDLNTIPRLLSEKAMANEDHSGLIFVSSKSFAQNDHAGLAQALSVVAREASAANWRNRVMFLSRNESRQS